MMKNFLVTLTLSVFSLTVIGGSGSIGGGGGLGFVSVDRDALKNEIRSFSKAQNSQFNCFYGLNEQARVKGSHLASFILENADLGPVDCSPAEVTHP